MAEANRPLFGWDGEPIETAIEHPVEFWKAHPSLLLETPRSVEMELAYHMLHHVPAGTTRTALQLLKRGTGALVTGFGTVLDDIHEGKRDPSKKLSRAEIAEHVAINVGTSLALEELLTIGLEVLFPEVLIPALIVSAFAPSVGAALGDTIFNNFFRRTPPPSTAEPSTLETNPDALSDLAIPDPLWEDEIGQLALTPFLDELPASHPDGMASGVVITVSGDGSMEGPPGSGFGSSMPKGGTGDGFGDGTAGSGAGRGNLSRLALPNDVPHGSYAFTRFMLDGPDPEPAWLQNLRMDGLEGVDGFPGFGDGKVQVPVDVAAALKPAPRASGSRLSLGRLSSPKAIPDSSGSFNLDLAPLDLPRPTAGASLFGNGMAGSFFDGRNDLLTDLSSGPGESSRDGIADPPGIARIIAAIDQLGQRLGERPVNAFLDGRDVTDIVNRHNARGSNGPLGSTSAFDSSAGFTPYGARTE